MRKIVLKNKKEAILSDTVGFISNLPHELVMAFRATLEEVLMADIVLHVIDVSNPNYKEQRAEVCKVLHELGRDKIENEDCYIEVYNKIDKLEGDVEVKNFGSGVLISAVSGKGCDELLDVLGESLAKDDDIREVELDFSDGKGIALEYSRGDVLERVDNFEKKRVYLKVRYSKKN